MKILVTGGTGVIGAGALPELLAAGHQVRLLSRGAERDAREYPRGVEPFQADVSDPASLRGAAAGCKAVIHITGIVEERPPDLTFENINVQGTRNILHAADEAGVQRFVFISSLGADRGQSEYHQSKRCAEGVVREFLREWVILRPGNVYGPGDDVISALLKMVRTLPVVPVIEGGEQRFQPIWYADLGRAIALAVSDPRAVRQVWELTGVETTTTAEVVDQLKEITGRSSTPMSIGRSLASAAVAIAETGPVQKMASKAGMAMPLNSSKLQMLVEENVIRPPARNALTEVLRIAPVSLSEGLRLLADDLPEMLPDEGVGSMERKQFSGVIPGHSAAEVMHLFRTRLNEVMPLEFSAEPGTTTDIEEGATLTAAIPGRGNIQVRVEEVTPDRVTFVTVEGHPLAGTVRFFATDVNGGAVFYVEIFARASNMIDWLAMRTIGRPLQNQNWKTVVQRLGKLMTGDDVDVEANTQMLDDSEAEQVERWLARLVQQRKRAVNEAAVR